MGCLQLNNSLFGQLEIQQIHKDTMYTQVYVSLETPLDILQKGHLSYQSVGVIT